MKARGAVDRIFYFKENYLVLKKIAYIPINNFINRKVGDFLYTLVDTIIFVSIVSRIIAIL